MMTMIAPFIEDVIHLPGLRGTTSRTYPGAAVGHGFAGTFEYYTASAVFLWQRQKHQNYENLIRDMHRLELAQNLLVQRLNDAEMQVLVNRTEGSPYDMVSIADVGFGVSQVLPVLVALRAANAGQLVYLEEPEIHLHPRAQVKLADILADAAKRGVRVVAETHSSLLLRAIQTSVAKGTLPADLVRLHWFSRDDEGLTQVRSETPDENGAFGDWPEDFGDVALQSEKEYLDAVESKLAR
jgi:predicted ATPase